MRTLLFLGLCVAVLTAAGIIHFKKNGDEVKVSIDTGKFEEKTEDIIDAVTDRISGTEDESPVEEMQEAMESAKEAGDELVEQTRKVLRDFKR